MRNYAWVGIIRNCAYNCANLCMLYKNVRNLTYVLICDFFSTDFPRDRWTLLTTSQKYRQTRAERSPFCQTLTVTSSRLTCLRKECFASSRNTTHPRLPVSKFTQNLTTSLSCMPTVILSNAAPKVESLQSFRQIFWRVNLWRHICQNSFWAKISPPLASSFLIARSEFFVGETSKFGKAKSVFS